MSNPQSTNPSISRDKAHTRVEFYSRSKTVDYIVLLLQNTAIKSGGKTEQQRTVYTVFSCVLRLWSSITHVFVYRPTFLTRVNPLKTKLNTLKAKRIGVSISSRSWKPLDQSTRLFKSCESSVQSGKLFWLVPVYEGWLEMCDTLFCSPSIYI